MTAQPRLLLGLAAVAVAFAAADTYVVVLALPEMMNAVGIPINELQRAAPIVSGFLLGYVAMLPLIGRIADLRGRVPVLVAALVIFAAGSLVTALAYDLPTMVSGRFLQGVGGGGLVPATLALVADLYPVDRRGVPLGVVSAVQEIGSVLGPLFGALVLAFADWRVIFLINLVVGLVLALALHMSARQGADPSETPRRSEAGEELRRVGDPATPERRSGRRPERVGSNRTKPRPDYLGALLLLITLVAGILTFTQPSFLLRDLTWGQVFIPFVSDGRWLSPVGVVAMAAAVLFLLRCATARRPLVDLRGWGRTMREADLVGALLLAAALSGVILAFGTADPKVQVFSDQGVSYLLGSALATAALVWHLRHAETPLMPRGAMRRTPAWGSLLVSFFIGAALIAALIDIPIFARTTVHDDSQLMAALVLVRFLIALPVGAVVGGYLTRRLPSGLITAVGMACAAVAFVLMSRWGLTSLDDASSNIALLLGGFGFGLALAPVNAAVLASTEHAVHGLATALVVVARMVGMLVGISALTTIGLRRYYAEQADLRNVREVCDGESRCAEFTELLKVAGIAQEQTVFLGAAVCAVIAGVLALVLFRSARTRSVDASEMLRSAG